MRRQFYGATLNSLHFENMLIVTGCNCWKAVASKTGTHLDDTLVFLSNRVKDNTS